MERIVNLLEKVRQSKERSNELAALSLEMKTSRARTFFCYKKRITCNLCIAFHPLSHFFSRFASLIAELG
jgi:hypothetical protein